MQTEGDPRWSPYIRRYTEGEWRGTIFHDMVLDDARALEAKRGKLTLLDIGCGGGFDNDAKLQRSLAALAGNYIGIEPDTEMVLGEHFTEVHRCLFEDAPIADESIDIAFAVMVMEHIENPQAFWDKLQRILKKGGIFWGFTIDARHWFVIGSSMTEKLGIKDMYLNLLHGKRGEDRYENYDVFYRTNTPEQVRSFTSSFAKAEAMTLGRVGQLDYYFPRALQWVGRTVDRMSMRRGAPGSTLAVRVEK